jgi:cold shock CspA family protein
MGEKVSIGKIVSVNADTKDGVIMPVDETDDKGVYYQFAEFADIDVAYPKEGQLVQFVKEDTNAGIQAKQITVLSPSKKMAS